MDQWVKNLWEKNKIFFFLLLPIVLLVIFRNVVFDLLLGSARKIFDNAQKKDSELLKSQVEANAKADQIVEDANKLSNNKTEVAEDWHKDE